MKGQLLYTLEKKLLDEARNTAGELARIEALLNELKGAFNTGDIILAAYSLGKLHTMAASMFGSSMVKTLIDALIEETYRMEAEENN